MEDVNQGSVPINLIKGAFLLLVACIPTAFIMLATPKSGINSTPRYIWPVVVVAIGKRIFEMIADTGTSFVINGVIMGWVVLVLIQCCNVLIVRKLDSDELVKGGIFRLSDGFIDKFYFTMRLLFNLRNVGNPWEVKRLHKFPSYYKGPKPSRSAYITRQVLIMAWQYLLLDIIYMSSLETPPEDAQRLFGPGTEFNYLNATAEQWGGRVAVGPAAGLAPARVSIDIPYRGFSILSVLLGLTSTDQWPPLFGSMWDAYTIRGFWNTFWHQDCLWPMKSLSNYICRDLLGLPRPSFIERYLNILIVFIASGAMHLTIDLFSYKPPSKAPTLAFFGSMALAIMLEDGVQDLCRRITGVDTRKKDVKVPLWHRLVGYVWVTTWMTLTAPWYLAHAAQLPAETKWLVPFSLVSQIGLPAAGALLGVSGLILKYAIGGEV
ncbi:MBOAT-2 domain-containing protein [Fusarium sp. LHS14.1]|nr:MBOAT-2 domain-containing protein [Fusarium sp. LHS14.1]